MNRWLKASGVGAIASGVDLAVLLLLVHGARLSPAAANVPALLAGALVQFVGARQLVFSASAGALGRQAARFALAECGTLALNALLFCALTAWTPLPIAACRLAATALVFVGFSFPAWARVFRPATA